MSAPYTAQAAAIQRPSNDDLIFYTGPAIPVTQLIPAGTYPVLSQLNNMCLDSGGSTANDARIQFNPYTGASDQLWTFNHLGQNVYYLVQKASGSTMDIPGSSTADGQYIQLHTASATNGANFQRVKAIKNADGTISLHMILENFGITIPGGTNAAGTVVVQSFCPETINPPLYQEWRIGGMIGGFTDQDIGSVGTAGSGSYVSSGSYTVNGSGGDIGGNADSGNFAYQSVTGDCTVIVDLASATWIGSIGKIGLMMRNSVNPNDLSAAIVIDYAVGNTPRMSYRTVVGRRNELG